jgi:hypothetical protein
MLHTVNVAHFSAIGRIFDVMSLFPNGFEVSQLPLLGVVEQVMAEASTWEYQDRPSLLYRISNIVRTCRSIIAAPY